MLVERRTFLKSTAAVFASHKLLPVASIALERSPENDHTSWREIRRGNPNFPWLSLTFDCGASGVPTPSILDALAERGIKTTFFPTGKYAAMYPHLVERMAADGHELGNHSWSHPDLRNLSDQQVIEEMEKAEEIIVAITGQATRPRWRLPYGYGDDRVASVVADAGWTDLILWSAASLDYEPNISLAQVKWNILNAAENGAIIVNHGGSAQMARVLPETLDELMGMGFEVTTVSKLLVGVDQR